MNWKGLTPTHYGQIEVNDEMIMKISQKNFSIKRQCPYLQCFIKFAVPEATITLLELGRPLKAGTT